ncbi:hypothetical protein F7734_43380 [Scytonema sp. UIC 10036]|uniref:hypothetical protein n=1 Tax=Scytonema sp. UIC 10036 TaxID=2304196 RepID=UPI0012DA8E5E|nr:hypothetical protein [Scytonema sp. UIC 10036]MUG98774.1 hypothetical protein [Scytonema sp. UIC 10036]
MGNSFFRYLQSLLKQQTKLVVIPVVGRAKDDFQNLFQLFNSPPYQEIGLLNELSARRLITRPAQGLLEYNEDAIKAILKLSAGHPYFTQSICFNLFIQATMEEKSSGDVLKFNHEGERQNKPILVKVENNQFRCLPPDGAKKELECR